jgi:hypothetical protein
VAQEVDRLFGKLEDLSSNPSPPAKKKGIPCTIREKNKKVFVVPTLTLINAPSLHKVTTFEEIG